MCPSVEILCCSELTICRETSDWWLRWQLQGQQPVETSQLSVTTRLERGLGRMENLSIRRNSLSTSLATCLQSPPLAYFTRLETKGCRPQSSRAQNQARDRQSTGTSTDTATSCSKTGLSAR